MFKTSEGSWDWWKITLAGVAGVIVLACGGGATNTNSGGGGSSDVTSKADNAASGDVVVSKCAISSNQFIGPEATLKVTNNSSKPSTYFISVAFVSKDGATQYDTGNTSVQALAPAQSTTVTASSLKSEARTQAAAGFSCKVLDVTRMAA